MVRILDAIAKKRDTSRAEIVREAIRYKLAKAPKKFKRKKKEKTGRVSENISVFIDTSAWLKIGLEKEQGHKGINEVLTRLITTQVFVEANDFYEKIYEAEKQLLENLRIC